MTSTTQIQTGQVQQQQKKISSEIFKTVTASSGSDLELCYLSIVAIAILSYWQSLQCFFFADDLLCLDYLYSIFNGKPQLLLERLVSPWQDPSISLLYRPLADLSLVFDFAFWQSNPFGYHLTNLCLHVFASLACFTFVDALLRAAKIFKSSVPAFLSAAIFAAYPLHIEPVLWICCRTDLASTALVLIFLSVSLRAWIGQARESVSIILASLSYLAALLFKESAACAIPILLVLLFFFGKQKDNPGSIRTRVIAICSFAAPFVGTTIAYFALRFLALGTVGGGYAGALGSALSDSWWTRIFDPEIPTLLALAGNVTVFKEGNLLFACLHALFFCVAGILFLRIPFLPWSKHTGRILLFFGAATVCAIAPAIQVAGITPTLTNSRVFYLASAFFIPLTVLAIYPLSDSSHETALESRIRALSSLVLSAIAATYLLMCNVALAPWIEGSRILRSLQIETVNRIIQCRSRFGSNAKVSILNVPSSIGGAHLMYEFRELTTLVGPAFYPGKDYGASLQATEEYPDFMAARMQHTRSCLQNPEHKAFWFSQRLSDLLQVDTNAQNAGSASQKSSVTDATKGIQTLKESGLKRQKSYIAAIPNLELLRSDQIQLELEFNSFAERPVLALALSSQNKIPSDDELFFFMLEYGKRGKQTFTVPTNVLRRAIDLSPSNQLYIRLSESCRLSSIRIIPELERAICSVNERTVIASQNGKFLLKDKLNPILHFDVSKVPGATGIYLEMSKANHFLHFASINAHDPHVSRNLQRTWYFASNKFDFELDRHLLKRQAIYQFRTGATDASGNLIGYYSDPIEFDLRPESTNHKNFY